MLNKVEVSLEVLRVVKELSFVKRKCSVLENIWPSEISAFGATDLGQKRRVNEDGFVINERMGLSLVVDGMGGHDDGVIATQMILNNFQAKLDCYFHKGFPKQYPYGEARAFLADVIEHVNTSVYKNNIDRGYGEGTGMGAVIAGLWWVEPGKRAIVFHVGDSRLYLFRKGDLTQLTVDHTMYQLWKMRGEFGHPPPSNIVFRALGPRKNVVPDIQLMDFVQDDVILLCSDGLSSVVSQAEIAAMMTEHSGDLSSLPQELIAQANAKGGPDNITAVVVSVGALLPPGG